MHCINALRSSGAACHVGIDPELVKRTLAAVTDVEPATSNRPNSETSDQTHLRKPDHRGFSRLGLGHPQKWKKSVGGTDPGMCISANE